MKITKGDIGWSGVLPTVVKALADWNPEPFQKEIECRDSLARFLREAAQGATVEAEYRHAGTTGVGAIVPIRARHVRTLKRLVAALLFCPGSTGDRSSA
jgi:hypothetical protein